MVELLRFTGVRKKDMGAMRTAVLSSAEQIITALGFDDTDKGFSGFEDIVKTRKATHKALGERH